MRWYGKLGVRSPVTFTRHQNGGLILSFGVGFLCRRPNNWRTNG